MIDVIIACWNRAETIERAISSALSQEHLGRVIVVDDGSSDDTPERIGLLAARDSRIVLIRKTVNEGPSAARNAALGASTAPWFTILDGDDFFLPGRLAGLLAFAEGYDFIADNLLQIKEHEAADHPPTLMIPEAEFPLQTLDFQTFVLGNVSRPGVQRKELGFFKPLIQRDFIEKNHLEYDRQMRLGEDFFFYAAALLKGARFRLVPSQGYVSVIRAGSLSGSHNQRDLERLRDCGFALRSLATSPEDRLALQEHYRSVDCRVQWLAVIQAVKDRSGVALAKAFFRSWKVSRFLVARLAEQVRLRLLSHGKA